MLWSLILLLMFTSVITCFITLVLLLWSLVLLLVSY